MRVQFATAAGGVSGVGGIDLGVLTGAVPPQVVDQVIEVAGCRERRRRLLPARVVVYVVLGMALCHGGDGFAPPGYQAVMRVLAGAGVRVASAAALCLARKRLGSIVFALLFEWVSGQGCAGDAGAVRVFGRRVVAWDATEIGVPDTPDNAADFGYPGQVSRPAAASPHHRLGSTPRLRLMTLTDTASHTVIDACFDASTKASEQQLARGLIASLRPGMLLLADRNFLGFDLWSLAVATGADLLWRAKSNRVFTPLTRLGDGSFLTLMPTPAETRRTGVARRTGLSTHTPRHGLVVRVIEYTITITATDGTTRTEAYRLVTTLLDAAHAPAEQLAACYHQRWEAETGYSLLKPRLIGTGAILRSRTPEGITQEIYAFLIVYQLLCQLRTEAASAAGCPPAAISFLVTLRAARAAIGHPHPHDQLIADILAAPKLKRRNRISPRQTRPRQTKYHTKNRDTPASTHVTYNINIQPRAA
ncbi:IS4 family transposase, partial [Rhizocola hellebori]|uniref:IS4 family transposase n=1 Tax=Rhizocola hellebori TaxID=1392758 RepID=UPI0019430F33